MIGGKSGLRSPANAKTELLKHIEQHKPDLASRSRGGGDGRSPK